VDNREAKIRKQTAVAYAIGRFSPFASYSRIVSTLAWTGPDFNSHLLSVMRAYEDRLGEVTLRGMRERIPYDVDWIPQFSYQAPPVPRRFMMALMDWILIASGTVVFFLAAYVSFVTREIV